MADWLNSADARSLWDQLNFARLYPEKTVQLLGDLKTHLYSALAYEPYAEDEQMRNQLITIIDERYGPDLRNLPQNKINTATLDKAPDAAQWIDSGGGKLIFYAWTADMQNDLMHHQQALARDVEGLDVPISESEAFFDLINDRRINDLYAIRNHIQMPTNPDLKDSLLKIIQLKHGKNLDRDLPNNQIDGEQATRANQYQKALRDLMGHVE